MCTGSRGRTSAWGGSGGKSNLSGITKRADTYLRTLLIQGAKSAVMTANRPWIDLGLGKRVALANFLARREDEDALNRSDRQQANSANPWWPRQPEFHAIGMEPR